MSQKHPQKPALDVQHLFVNYGHIPVLWDITLTVPSSEIVAIVGPNGAGKTTFLKAAMGLIKPLSGTILFFSEFLKTMRSSIAYVPQRESVDWDFPITVLEVVLMGRFRQIGLCRRPRKADIESARHYLSVVGLEDLAGRQISQLSGGQQQRVFLARALLQEAQIYFMDEPFAGVDAATEKVFVDLFHALKKEGKTVFVVHHDLNTLQSYFSWVIMINLRLVACGPISEVYNSQTLQKTYGRHPDLLDVAARLKESNTSGLL